MLNVAVIGAGAVAECAYLPAIDELPNTHLHAVVDIDEGRARNVATRFSAHGYTTDAERVLDEIDVAIIATPPASHAEIAEACLRAGVHVFTEKPVATSRDEAATLVALAEDRSVHYAVSRQLRESPSCRLVRLFVTNGALGELESFELTFGDRTEWDFASGYRVQESQAWGGVLTDKAPHGLDLLLWIFGDRPTVNWYGDDSFGGLEANARMEIAFDPPGISGEVEFTASRALENVITVRGDRAWIEAHPDEPTATLIDRHTDERTTLSSAREDEPHDYLARIGAQVQRFVESVRTDRTSYVPAREGVPLVSMIEHCYAEREQVIPSWEAPHLRSGRSV